MNLKFSFFLARKYIKHKWSLMTTLSILMISFGIVTLTAILSIMNGFHSTFRKKILETNTYHIIIFPELAINTLKNINPILSKNKDIISIIPYFDGEAIIKSNWGMRGIIVKALPENILGKDEGFKREIKVTSGKFDISNNNIMIGEELGRELSVNPGDYVSLLTFGRGETLSSIPSVRLFKVSGFVKTGYWDYDRSMVFISLDAARSVFGISESQFYIGLKIKNIFRAERVKQWLEKHLLEPNYVSTWMEVNRALFEALQNEKMGIGFVVMLIIISGGFNIVGSLVMIVMDKRKDIGILRALGASPSIIMRTFIMDGLIIGMVGTLIGITVGLFLTIHIQEIFNLFEWIINGIRDLINILILQPLGRELYGRFELLSDSVYYIEGVPTEIHFWDVFTVSILAIIVSVVAALYPAKKASQTNPVDVIRSE